MKNPSNVFVLPKVVINQTAKDTKELSKKKEKGEYLNWGTALWKLPKTWKQEKGQGVKVAVLDTGVDLNHPDLKDGIKECAVRYIQLRRVRSNTRRQSK